MPIVVRVKQGETKFIEVEDGNTLETDGISTCIAIMLQAHIGNKSFILMKYWDGFDGYFDKNSPDATQQAAIKVKSMFAAFAIAIENQGEFSRSGRMFVHRPCLDKLFLFGGERAQSDLSGTEFEVEALSRAEEYCRLLFNVSAESLFSREHYLTCGNDSLKIIFSASGVSYTMNEYCSSEEEESSEYSDDSDEEDNWSFTS